MGLHNRTMLFVLTLVFSLVLSFIQATLCYAVEDGSGIEKKLDGDAQMTFADITLGKSLELVSKRIDVQFEIDQAAITQLPHGSQTQLASVELAGITWRIALRELLKPFALRFQVGMDRIYILGTTELMKQPHRLSILELTALTKLQNTTLIQNEQELLAYLTEKTGISFTLVTDGKRADKAAPRCLSRCLTTTGQEATRVLDTYSRIVNHPKIPTSIGTWYLKEITATDTTTQQVDIIILSPAQLLEIKLDQRITVDYRKESIQTILLDLAKKARLKIKFQPGCLALLDDDIRESLSLVMREATLKTAIETFVATTGLQFDYTENTIIISAGDNLRNMALASAKATQKQSPLVCLITTELPGTGFQTNILIRKEDLQGGQLFEKYKLMQKDRIKKFIDFLNTYELPDDANTP